MASEKKNASNKINGSKSKGPTSVRGNQHARFSALTFGFFAKTQVLPGEDARDLERLHLKVRDELGPIGVIEDVLVWDIVDCLWRIRRINAAEQAFFLWVLKLQVIDRKFEVRDFFMTINGKKIRSEAETREILMKHAKDLEPTAEDVSNTMRTMFETNSDVSEKADRRRKSLRKEMFKLLDVLNTRQERRSTFEGPDDVAAAVGGGPSPSDEGPRVVPFPAVVASTSTSSGEA